MSPEGKKSRNAIEVMAENLKYLEEAAKAKAKELGVKLDPDKSRLLGRNKRKESKPLKEARDFWFCVCLFLQIDIPKRIKPSIPVEDALIDFLKDYDSDAEDSDAEKDSSALAS